MAWSAMCAWLWALLLVSAKLARAHKNFIYNNTYEYDRDYTIILNASTEYVLEFLENGDDNSDHPARVTVSSKSANQTYPLFITTEQQKGVLSWQLPMVVETARSSEQFSSIARTLCPHNGDQCETSTINNPIIHLSTSSPVNITTTIRVKRVLDFYVQLYNETSPYVTNVTVTPSQPKYYYYSFGQSGNMSRCAKRGGQLGLVEKMSIPRLVSPKSVVLVIESDDDVCATVSIQNFSCPVFDNERDVLYGGYYLTMMRKGGITLNQAQFPLGFYIVLLVKASDEECVGRDVNLTSVAFTKGDRRTKRLRFQIVETISYKEYMIAALAGLGFLSLFYLAVLCGAACGAACERRRGELGAPLVEHAEGAPLAEEEIPTAEETAPARRRNLPNGEGASSRDGQRDIDGDSISDTDSDYSALDDADREKDIYRRPIKLTLASLCRKRPVILRGRSDKYLWGVITIAVFYSLPVIQLVITYQAILQQTGNQDLCYYNFLCAHPLGLLSDFNHVYTNLGYVLLGALFIVVVRRRHNRLRQRPHAPNHGIPQHFGLFYAMGVALMMEGILSASYHFCPNTMNFQFDSSFMYVIAVLSMVKIYQTRHPDINARAHSTFGVLACIIFIGLSGILSSKYSDLNLYFWILFTLLHLAVCLLLTFQIYYMGRFKLDGGLVRRAWREVRRAPAAALRPHYAARFALLVLANAANWALAAYGVYEHKKDFAVHLLAVLMGNTILYTLSYFAMKLVSREPVRARAWLLIVAAHCVWFTSLYFFLNSRTKWSRTPAQSRSYNAPCTLLDFYDVHDLWHLLSAAALFLSFCLLLTLDDGMEDVPQNQIAVF